jgi:hypothetical protein
MENHFDELAKLLAGDMPRREALKRLGGLFVGAIAASLGLQGRAWGRSPVADCIQTCCRGTTGRARAACNQACQQGLLTSCGGVCCRASLCISGTCCLPPRVVCGKTAATLVCCLGGFLCINGVCVPPTNCSNGMKDGSETDVDCGGPICPRCPNFNRCLINSDCISGKCQNGICVP